MATNRELDHQYRMARLKEYSSRWRAFFRVLLVATLGTTVVLSLRQLTGQHTFADIEFKIITDLRANRSLALIFSWLLTTCTSGWAVGERRLRKKHIARVSSEASKMQKEIDPRRRSSQLMTDGDTRPEDE